LHGWTHVWKQARAPLCRCKPAPRAGTMESFDLKRYTDAASLFDALSFTVEGLHPVGLVRMSWLLQQRGTVLKRRQELLEEAFVPADELRDVYAELPEPAASRSHRLGIVSLVLACLPKPL
ncbi:unnamed protein product, partial [Prorocentrum cordatum]